MVEFWKLPHHGQSIQSHHLLSQPWLFPLHSTPSTNISSTQSFYYHLASLNFYPNWFTGDSTNTWSLGSHHPNPIPSMNTDNKCPTNNLLFHLFELTTGLLNVVYLTHHDHDNISDIFWGDSNMLLGIDNELLLITCAISKELWIYLSIWFTSIFIFHKIAYPREQSFYESNSIWGWEIKWSIQW